MVRRFKNILLIFFLMGLIFKSCQVFSQSIKVVSATKQGWSGGVCCRTGISYHIQLQIVGKRSKVKLDSLWMEGYCLDISSYNSSTINKTDSSHVIVYGGVTWDEGMPQENHCFNAARKGVVISYYIKGRKNFKDITPYIKELEYQVYP